MDARKSKITRIGMKRKKLGQVLQERGHIGPIALAQAVAEQQGKVIHLGELLLDRDLVAKNDLIAALEEVTHAPYVNCLTHCPDPEILALIPKAMAIRCCIFPIAMEGSTLLLAMSEPQNLRISEE